MFVIRERLYAHPVLPLITKQITTLKRGLGHSYHHPFNSKANLDAEA